MFRAKRFLEKSTSYGSSGRSAWGKMLVHWSSIFHTFFKNWVFTTKKQPFTSNVWSRPQVFMEKHFFIWSLLWFISCRTWPLGPTGPKWMGPTGPNRRYSNTIRHYSDAIQTLFGAIQMLFRRYSTLFKHYSDTIRRYSNAIWTLFDAIQTLFRRYSDAIPTLFRRYSDTIRHYQTLFRRYSDAIQTLFRHYPFKKNY